MKKKIYFIIFLSFFIMFLICTKSKCAEIPKVYIQGNISNMNDKKDERNVLLKYKSDDVNFEKYTKIKVQGSSSLVYEKKNYTINFYEDDSYEKKSKVDMQKGWGEQSKYNLKANWIDKTHSRNIVSARLAGKVQEKYGVLNDLPNHGSIDGFPVEVYLNNEFFGLYTWNIPKDEWMFGIEKDNPEHLVLEGGWYTDYVNFKKYLDGFDGTGWEVEAGTTNKETVANFNRLINFINNSSDEEFIKDFDKYLNKDATLNYMVMIYLIEGIDNTGKNMMLLTYDNGRIWYPCLYDLDSTWGTWTDGSLNKSYKILPEDEIADHSTNNLFLRMIKTMPNEVSKRWFDLRKDIFLKESILSDFKSFEASIPEESFEKEKQRWKDIPGYEIDQIEEFLDVRLNFVDGIMKERHQTVYSKFVTYLEKIKKFFENIISNTTKNGKN